MAKLFAPLRIRNTDFKNRIFLSPMCQYSGTLGHPNDWHLVHLGSHAVGGTGLVMTEAVAVSPEGRITPADLGIWSDAHVEPFQRITSFIREQGAVSGIQIAHAGRKASSRLPWEGGSPLARDQGGWTPIAPSAVPYAPNCPTPQELTENDLERIATEFESAATRAFRAGFQALEIHMAHGYLLHQFLSPISNRRTDEFGGSFENRCRFPLGVAHAVRKVWRDNPLFVRISSVDGTDRGWTIEDSVRFCKLLREEGIDLIDCSSGGITPSAQLSAVPGFQVAFADRIRRESEIMTAAVGMITEPKQAEEILAEDQADAIFMGRALLRDPYWPRKAAAELQSELPWPKQYERAKEKPRSVAA